jgi:hypothetical protein
MATKLKTLPPSALEKLIRENKTIYVLNTSALPTGDKGVLMINFYDGKRRDYFKMPPTFIPMAISDAVPSSSLRESRDFKQLLLKRALTLVDPTSAEQYLESPEAQDEYESLVLSEMSMQKASRSVENELNRRATAQVNNVSMGPLDDMSSATEAVSNKVRATVESMIGGVVKAKEALQQLRRHQSAFTEADYSYVIANSTDAALTKWARTGLAEMTRQPQPQVVAAKGKVKPAKKAPKGEIGGDAFDFDTTGAPASEAHGQALNGETMYDKVVGDLVSGRR